LNTYSDAARKPLFPRGPGLGLKFLLCAVLSTALMVTDGSSDRLAPLRQWSSVALRPLLWVASAPQAMAEWGEHFRSREALVTENRQLREDRLRQEARLLKLAALEAENERIRALLSSSAALPDRVLIAEVLSASQDPYRHQIVLNKGSQDGVYRGQALIDASGVMGQVIQVNPNTCIALLLTDPDHGIPVEINRTGLQTIALGRGDGQGLSLPYLPGNADVKVGDLLVSSGLGGRFPAGYPVGEVHELRHPAGENFMEAVAYPTARLNQGRQALLVWSERPPQLPEPATEAGPKGAKAAVRRDPGARKVPLKRGAPEHP
jgi:rod shape-determining protein MreC